MVLGMPFIAGQRKACPILALAAACAALLLPGPATAGTPVPATVVVEAGSDLGPTNQALTGVGWNTGSLAGVAPLAPTSVRIDASLEAIVTAGPDGCQLDVAPLLERVAAVRAVGAEPQVILSYMPLCMARSFPGDFRDRTKVRPADYDAWETLVEDVVRAVATAPAPARRFEVWNEPDLPTFWQDTLPAWLDLAERTHRAVATVAAETGLPLEVGGPATFFADPAWIGAYVTRTRAAGLPLDFVSWHWYGNHPFLGPDGREAIVPEPFYTLLARRNPAATPMAYGDQTVQVRALVTAALAGREAHFVDPDLVIDEWNVAAGGFDLRHDTSEGAAFDAASLIEMEAADLDGADFYRAADGTPGPGEGVRRGDWGLVDAAGGRKPSWWVFDAWGQTAGTRLAVSGDQPAAGWWARASRSGGRIDVLLSSFSASVGVDRAVEVVLGGAACSGAELRTLDATSDSFETFEVVPVSQVVDLPLNSVAWVRFTGCQP